MEEVGIIKVTRERVQTNTPKRARGGGHFDLVDEGVGGGLPRCPTIPGRTFFYCDAKNGGDN